MTDHRESMRVAREIEKTLDHLIVLYDHLSKAECRRENVSGVAFAHKEIGVLFNKGRDIRRRYIEVDNGE